MFGAAWADSPNRFFGTQPPLSWLHARNSRTRAVMVARPGICLSTSNAVARDLSRSDPMAVGAPKQKAISGAMRHTDRLFDMRKQKTIKHETHRNQRYESMDHGKELSN